MELRLSDYSDLLAASVTPRLRLNPSKDKAALTWWNRWSWRSFSQALSWSDHNWPGQAANASFLWYILHEEFFVHLFDCRKDSLTSFYRHRRSFAPAQNLLHLPMSGSFKFYQMNSVRVFHNLFSRWTQRFVCSNEIKFFCVVELVVSLTVLSVEILRLFPWPRGCSLKLLKHDLDLVIQEKNFLAI